MKKNKGLQTEIDAAYLYQQLAVQEEDTTIAEVYRQMSAIEKGHAQMFMQKATLSSERMAKPPGEQRP